MVGVASASLTARRRRAALIAAGAVVLIVILAASCGGDDKDDKAVAEKPKLALLPGGGRRIFPANLVVAYYGAPQARELGELGIGSPDHAGRKLLKQAAEYAGGGHKVLPAMELIAEIAQGQPGDDGLYRARQKDAVIRRYLEAARKIKALLILDIQPGHAGFFEEAQYFAKWLKEPDVSLALDPEWHTPDAVPGTVIGSMDVREANAISFWLEQIVHRYKLPQKLLVIHRFTDNGIQGIEQLKPRRDVAVTVNVDGFGENPIKVAKYKQFAQRLPGLHNGFKLFYHEDPHTMKPRRVLRIRPRPELVVYE
jgi:hypothetical protein